MADTTTQPGVSTPASTGHAAVRLVLVGTTGLEGRLSEEFRTVKARTPLEAVGELASRKPAEASKRTIVVVGPDAEPNGALPAFLEAVRRAAPAVCIARAGGGAERSDGYDAVLDEADAPTRLLRLAGLEVSSPASEADEAREGAKGDAELKPVGDARRQRAGAPAMSTTTTSREDAPVPAVGATVGDEAMLAALDASRETLVRAALDLIARRIDAREVRFLPQAETDTELAPVPSVPVAGGGKRLGSLRAAGVPVERLVPHASWLGGWLSLHDRQQSLRRAAFTDPLTGAWNRRYFDGFLQAALDRARETRRTVTVLVFDIDEFKQYNDNYGHPAGDEILIEVVRALQASVRPSDRVCRIGGDEFAVIFDDPQGPRQQGSRPPESVYVLAKRVQKKIGEKKFPKLGADAPGKLTISGGLAAFPWDGHDAETLLEKADDLACASKRQGKNAITLGPGAERVCRHNGDDLRD